MLGKAGALVEDVDRPEQRLGEGVPVELADAFTALGIRRLEYHHGMVIVD